MEESENEDELELGVVYVDGEASANDAARVGGVRK